MHRKLKEFFDTKGRRLAELKAAGGQEFMILGQSSRLTPAQVTEFRLLTVQMDSIIWALEPKDPAKREQYVDEIKEYFADIEEPYFRAEEIKQGRKLLRGKA